MRTFFSTILFSALHVCLQCQCLCLWLFVINVQGLIMQRGGSGVAFWCSTVYCDLLYLVPVCCVASLHDVVHITKEEWIEEERDCCFLISWQCKLLLVWLLWSLPPLCKVKYTDHLKTLEAKGVLLWWPVFVVLHVPFFTPYRVKHIVFLKYCPEGNWRGTKEESLFSQIIKCAFGFFFSTILLFPVIIFYLALLLRERRQKRWTGKTRRRERSRGNLGEAEEEGWLK